MPELLELHQLVESEDGTNRSRRSKSYDLMSNCYSCPFLGIILATLSSFFFSLCSVLVKKLVDINPIELASFRFLGILLPSIPIMIYKQEEVFPTGKRLILLLRCFVGTTGLMLSFYAFRHMPLADASVIIFLTPVFVAIFANIFLKEPCGIFNAFTILLTLFGVVLITRPAIIFGNTVASTTGYQIINENLSNNIWGPVAAVSSALFGANAYVTLRALRGIHYSVIMSNFGAFAVIYTVAVSWFLDVICLPYCNSDRWLVLALGAFSFLGEILLTVSLQLEEACPVAIARSADIVFAFVWQILFFKEIPNIYSIIGALIVTFSVILTGLKKWSQSLPRESIVRKRLRYILLEVWI